MLVCCLSSAVLPGECMSAVAESPCDSGGPGFWHFIAAIGLSHGIVPIVAAFVLVSCCICFVCIRCIYRKPDHPLATESVDTA